MNPPRSVPPPLRHPGSRCLGLPILTLSVLLLSPGGVHGTLAAQAAAPPPVLPRQAPEAISGVGTPDLAMPVLLRGPEAARPPLPSPTFQEEGEGAFLGIAKWTSLAIAVGASTWGFLENAQADRAFDTIEEVCEREPERCEGRNLDGSFTDPLLEERFREVLAHDDRAQVGLILGQVAIATTVVLFIMDLDGEGDTEDIPFRPPRTRVRNGRAELVTGIPISFR